MKLIAHRGNINGPSSDENNPQLIEDVLAQGYDAEIDVHFVNGTFWLGHDEPVYKIDVEFLKRDGLWCHAKNFGALIALKTINIKNFFWHENDAFTLTSSGYIWTYPGQPLLGSSIAVMPETVMDDILSLPQVYGVCSDYVSKFK